tara:strand:- start:158 stop:649 length:492 start_codon:yes stop_codon:yes gene_type:complete
MKKIIKYPASFWVIAEEIANARTRLNKSNRKNNPRFDRGNKNNYVDVLGVVGELIVLNYLTEKNIDYTMIKILNPYPSKEADFTVKNKRIDVKTNEDSKYKSVLVNEEAHKKGLGKIDLYWFVYIIDKQNCEFYFADYNDVSKWDCKLMKYTNAYYSKIKKLW